ncbi:Uncharacterized membrane protein YdjX, TVP38/TMEM64 family, SNARE-associated domain [Syntrophus gentianae]|uniref:TVP38/TMEM64 family membrane protein n=1 Tax=Syntrophus gentianae TaxID=43775 RepID=A0A1H7UF87_9BACT|nr:VTT domain-containing protein [Syntrophus gentianae]SEL94897.1 Uncharacterized membrane protein YdjX, TVP38/TMEM64 family, SNARE-associated domain [Syntrophus gentianae]
MKKPDPRSFLSMRKDLLFIAAFFLMVLVLNLTPLKEHWTEVLAFFEGLKRYGALAPFIFTVSVAALVCIGIPRLFLCTLGGMLFGFYRGLLFSLIGTMVGYYLIFSGVRKVGGAFIVRRYHKINRFTKLLERGGIPGVILARQLPIHGMVINLVLGLSPVRRRDFLVGTAIGLIPEAIPFTLIGKGIKQDTLQASIAYLVIAVVILAVLWLGLKIWSEKKRMARK